MTSEITASVSTGGRTRPSEHQGGSRPTPLDRTIVGGPVAGGHDRRHHLLEPDQDELSFYVQSEVRTE